jgi:hypothetical protein
VPAAPAAGGPEPSRATLIVLEDDATLTQLPNASDEEPHETGRLLPLQSLTL